MIDDHPYFRLFDCKPCLFEVWQLRTTRLCLLSYGFRDTLFVASKKRDHEVRHQRMEIGSMLPQPSSRSSHPDLKHVNQNTNPYIADMLTVADQKMNQLELANREFDTKCSDITQEVISLERKVS